MILRFSQEEFELDVGNNVECKSWERLALLVNMRRVPWASDINRTKKSIHFEAFLEHPEVLL